MAMNQLDKVRLMGVIKKKKIDCYDDLYIDSRSNLNIYDFLDATADIAIKFITSDFNEKQIENSLNAIVFVLVKINSYYLSIEDNNTYKKLISLKEYKGKFNDMIDALIDSILGLTTQTCVQYDENYEAKEDAEEEPEEKEIDYEEEYNLSLDKIKNLEEKISTFDLSSLYWQILLWSATRVSSPEFSVFCHLFPPTSFSPSGFWNITRGIVP